MGKLSQNNFIERVREAVGTTYDLSKAVYVNNRTKVTIICPEHGEFEKFPTQLFEGSACEKCRLENIRVEAFNKWLEDAKRIHDNKYDYSKVNYINSSTDVIIICPKHGEFSQRPSNHLYSGGCYKCGCELKGVKFDLQNNIAKSIAIHGNKYTYEKCNPKTTHDKMQVFCTIHKYYFTTTFNSLLQGKGCRKCGRDKIKLKHEAFIDKANTVHGKYEYPIPYIDTKTKIPIVCQKHGTFYQSPNHHISRKCGCPKCSKSVSKWECDLRCELIKRLPEIEILGNDRTMLNGKELDIYIPSRRLGIECNGTFWHGKDRQKERDCIKAELCEQSDIELITVWDTDYLKDKEQTILTLVTYIKSFSKNDYEKDRYWREYIAQKYSISAYQK